MNATLHQSATATGVAAAPERRQPMIRPFPSAKKKIPATSWPTIHRNRPQQPRSSANFWPIFLSMKTHPPSWNPTAAIRSKLKPRRQQLTALTGGVRNGQQRTTCPVSLRSLYGDVIDFWGCFLFQISFACSIANVGANRFDPRPLFLMSSSL